jgi:2-C-methyl-D-erythritol 4-phosphate cytidylyltransferase/2-C-methyl-D-erythritol 2,4-cyclodiphosphate synthase
MRTAALIAAGGRGTRAAADLPKQYARLGDSHVLTHTLKAFLGHRAVDLVQVVIGAGDRQLYRSAVAALAADDRLLAPVTGGATRRSPASPRSACSSMMRRGRS